MRGRKTCKAQGKLEGALEIDKTKQVVSHGQRRRASSTACDAQSASDCFQAVTTEPFYARMEALQRRRSPAQSVSMVAQARRRSVCQDAGVVRMRAACLCVCRLGRRQQIKRGRLQTTIDHGCLTTQRVVASCHVLLTVGGDKPRRARQTWPPARTGVCNAGALLAPAWSDWRIATRTQRASMVELMYQCCDYLAVWTSVSTRCRTLLAYIDASI